jgi:hypothetical protein
MVVLLRKLSSRVGPKPTAGIGAVNLSVESESNIQMPPLVLSNSSIFTDSTRKHCKRE